MHYVKPIYNNSNNVKPHNIRSYVWARFFGVLYETRFRNCLASFYELSWNFKKRSKKQIKNLFGRIYLDYIPDLRLTRFLKKNKHSLMTQQQQ